MAYEYRCAVCAFDLRLDRAPVGLDAAHIRWKQAGRPVFFFRPIALWTCPPQAFIVQWCGGLGPGAGVLGPG